MTAGKLTNKQAVFVAEYLISLNASDAARKAGYSPKTAHRSGQENMQKPAIAAAIQKAKTEAAARCEITTDMVLRGLLAEATGKGKGSSHSARVAAWTQLGKHTGAFERDNTQKQPTIIIEREDAGA